MSASTPEERLRIALDMAATGIEMKRMQFRREQPEWDESQVAAAMRAWLQDRPGAPYGDYPGKPSLRRLGDFGGHERLDGPHGYDRDGGSGCPDDGATS